jgi:hypothetical protein
MSIQVMILWCVILQSNIAQRQMLLLRILIVTTLDSIFTVVFS